MSENQEKGKNKDHNIRRGNLKTQLSELEDLLQEPDQGATRAPPSEKSFSGHKGNLKSALDKLASFERSESDESGLSQHEKSNQKITSAPSAPPSHQQTVRTAIRELTAVDATLEVMKKQEVSSKQLSAPSNSRRSEFQKSVGKGTKEEIDETLEKTQYLEDEIDHLLAERGEDKNKWYKWVENTMDTVLHRVAFLTLIASALTACTCYMFIRLPNDIYSTHILREIYWINDDVIAANGLSHDFGIQNLTPLPGVVGLMFLSILYIVYVIQYPKQGKIIAMIRHTIFFLIQSYMIICLISYMVEISLADGLLDNYFEYDKEGKLLKGWPEGENHSERLHGLYHAQEYLGCCGYRDREVWAEVYPEKYTNTYPLTCCDAERSGIACYYPVEEEVTYSPPVEDQDDEESLPVTKPRLYESTCHRLEQLLFEIVSTTIIILLTMYIALSSWTLWTLRTICTIVTEKDITIMPAPQYIDSL